MISEKEIVRNALLGLAGEIRLRMDSMPAHYLWRAERYGYEWVMEQIGKRISLLEKE